MPAHLVLSTRPVTTTHLLDLGLLEVAPPHLDILTVPPDGPLTIDQVRQLPAFLKTAPVKLDHKYALFLEAQRLTLPAQHALLKTLEEPPPYARLLLTAPSPSTLLPTLVSRCLLHRLSSAPPEIALTNQIKQVYASLPQATIPERLGSARSCAADRGQAQAALVQLLSLVHRRFRRHPGSETAVRLERLLEAIYRLDHQANPLLTLEHLFLHW